MTNIVDNWRHKDEWRRDGKDFIVVVSRHYSEPSLFNHGEGVNRWAVYAYIYPAHPHFEKFRGNDLFQIATSCLPLHAGPSTLKYHNKADGTMTSVQVGADYHHLYDDHYTHYATRDEARSVFIDAERLFDVLSAMNAHQTEGADQ